jgi:DNA polymerase-3 subunit epsilon
MHMKLAGKEYIAFRRPLRISRLKAELPTYQKIASAPRSHYVIWMNFTAIDFETATGKRDSACAVGIVTVENGKITEEYYSLIQPPDNQYFGMNIAVHGIQPRDTASSPTFDQLYPEIRKRLQDRILVAHNEAFDRSVLKRTMEYYDLYYGELGLADRWECTMRIYKAKGFVPYKLNSCCERLGIPLQHHEALSDAIGCANLYLRHATGY